MVLYILFYRIGENLMTNNNSLEQKWEEMLILMESKVPKTRIKHYYKNSLLPKKYDEQRNILSLECTNSYIQNLIVRSHLFELESFSSIVFKPGCKVEFKNTESSEENKDNKIEFSTTSSITPEFDKENILNPRNNFDNFVVGANNQFAHAAALAVAENPATSFNPLFFYGGPGLGKTHLMHAIGHYLLANNDSFKALYVSSEMFTNEFINSLKTNKVHLFKEKYRNVDILLIDDIQFLHKKEATQEEFFHTFNALYDNNKQIVISSDKPPKDLDGIDERLRQRFGWSMTVDIKPPNYETRFAILEKKAEKKEIDISNEEIKKVFYYIAENIKYNIRDLEGALSRLIGFSDMMHKDIDIPFAQEVLSDIVTKKDNSISIDSIKSVVCKECGITMKQIESKEKSRKIAHPRQIAMYLSRELTNTSLPKIGSMFGGRDHSTVLHAFNKIKKEKEENESTKILIEKIKENFTL